MLVRAAFESAEPLSQVVFVHDYIQLRFQDLGLSMYGRVKVNTPAGELARSDSGYCDSIVALIGQRIVAVEDSHPDYLQIVFSSGSALSISLKREGANGPEVFQLNRPGMPPIVAQVA